MHLTRRSLKPLNEERSYAERKGNSLFLRFLLLCFLIQFLYMNLLVIQMFYSIVSLLDHNQARVSM
jgi:hypothetical protein